jgi:hypothetical protein
MAHYAVLDENNVVVNITVGRHENDLLDGHRIDWELYYNGKRTSYNTRGGVHLLGGTPFRKNCAGVGYIYDATRDAFIPPKPFESWTLNEETCLWDSPVPYPKDLKAYVWDEQSQKWVDVVLEGQTPVQRAI